MIILRELFLLTLRRRSFDRTCMNGGFWDTNTPWAARQLPTHSLYFSYVKLLTLCTFLFAHFIYDKMLGFLKSKICKMLALQWILDQI